MALTIAIVGSKWASGAGGGATFEEDVLSAALSLPREHKLVVYPASANLKAAIRDSDLTGRVALVKQVKDPILPSRVLRRAGRFVRRRKAPLPFSALGDVLKKAGAHCAWLLGGSQVPLDLPYVATLWDLQHRVQPWFPEVSAGGEWRERERLVGEYVRRAASVVVGTAVGAAEVREAYGNASGALEVIPLPTPTFAIAAGMRPRLPRPADLPTRYLLYPAQFWAHKNHITAVRAVAELRSIAGAPHLVLVGSDKGTQAHVLEEARALGISDRVHTPGFVDRSRLVALYQHAEALIHPSLFGPDNLPPLEAMALGCPVIAANVPGAEEQLGDGAVLVDGLDSHAFASAVRALRYEPEARDAMVDRARERARGWTAAQYVDAILALFDRRIAPMRSLWA